MSRWRTGALATAALVAACRPSLDEDLSHVDGPRILAVQSDPPEAKPGSPVTLHALYTDGSVTLTTGALSWDFCITRPALAEATTLSSACLTGAPGALVLLGSGISAFGVLPSEACRLFGPEQPLAAVAGQPAGRPADPDLTGGYYLPGLVHADGADDATFSVRIRCGLANATQEVTASFEQTYHANTNPALDDVKVTRATGGSESVADGAEITAATGETLTVDGSWPPCPDANPCAGAETYPAFDPTAQTLVTRRESMRISWLSTRGHFLDVRSARDEADPTLDVSTTWTAPSSPMDATLWLVLRDARGGTSFRSLRVHVQ